MLEQKVFNTKYTTPGDVGEFLSFNSYFLRPRLFQAGVVKNQHLGRLGIYESLLV